MCLPCLVCIKDYYLSLLLVSVFLVPPCCVHRDRRPDQNSKRRPFTLFIFFRFLKVFCLVPVCLLVPRHGPRPLPSALARVKSAWEFGGMAASAASPLAASPPARRSREKSAAIRGSFKPVDHGRYPPPPTAIPCQPFTRARRSREMTPLSVAHRARCSREMMPPSAAPRARRSREMTPPSAAHPGPPFTGDDAVHGSPNPPFAGDHAAVRGSPRPAVRGRSRRRYAADSMPAGPPLTLAPWIQSTCYGQECRF